MADTTIHLGKRTFTILFPDLLRPLSAGERQTLKTSIKRRGVEVPVVIDEEGGVIDGGNRVQLAAEVGLLNVPVSVQKGLSLEEKAELALALNAARRHLSPGEQKGLHKHREERIARVVEKRRAGMSLRAIAEEEDVSHEQIRADLEEAGVKGGLTPEPAEIQGQDGKTYHVARPAPGEAVPAPAPAANGNPDGGLRGILKAWKKATPEGRQGFLRLMGIPDPDLTHYVPDDE